MSTPTRIETAFDFFTHVVQCDVDDFCRNSVDLRTAFHAAGSLLSLRDWVFVTQQGTTWAYHGDGHAPFRSKAELQDALESISDEFAIVADIANASKHMVLDSGRRRTNLFGAANTEYMEVASGTVGGHTLGEVPLGGNRMAIVVKIDNVNHEILPIIVKVNRIWSDLFEENQW